MHLPRISIKPDWILLQESRGSRIGITRLDEYWQTVILRDVIFYSSLTQIMDFYFLTIKFLVLILKKSTQKLLNTLRCNISLCHHFDITMISLDCHVCVTVSSYTILLTGIKQYLVLKIIFGVLFEWPLKTDFTVHNFTTALSSLDKHVMHSIQ